MSDAHFRALKDKETLIKDIDFHRQKIKEKERQLYDVNKEISKIDSLGDIAKVMMDDFAQNVKLWPIGSSSSSAAGNYFSPQRSSKPVAILLGAGFPKMYPIDEKLSPSPPPLKRLREEREDEFFDYLDSATAPAFEPTASAALPASAPAPPAPAPAPTAPTESTDDDDDDEEDCKDCTDDFTCEECKDFEKEARAAGVFVTLSKGIKRV